VAHIEDKSNTDLKALLAEADSKGKGDILRKAWREDIEDRKAFQRDQKQNGQMLSVIIIVKDLLLTCYRY